MAKVVVKTCACGCGRVVKTKAAYALGHHPNSRRTGTTTSIAVRRKISNSCKGRVGYWLGRHRSEETKQKISMKKKGAAVSEETKRKISEALKGKILSDENKRKMHEGLRIWRLAHPPMPKVKVHISKQRKNIKMSEEAKRKLSLLCMGKKRTEETKKRIAAAMRLQWQDPIFKEKRLKAIFKGLSNHPNRPEKELKAIIDELFPGKYRYVGDGTVWIAGKNPDFIHIKGKKKVIELFGDFWHSERVTNTHKQDDEEKRIAHFTSYGFDVLIVWENELKYKTYLRKKLRKFHCK